jgi:hypothetical protein
MNEKQKARLKVLTGEKRKWWGTIGEDLVPAFYFDTFSSILEVSVWVDKHNFKRVVHPERTDYLASNKAWPTKEGALLYGLEKAQKRIDKGRILLDRAEEDYMMIRSLFIQETG